MTTIEDCLFCRIIAEDIPSDTVYQDDEVLAFRDIAPQAPTHVLVVPRHHIEHAGAVTEDEAHVMGRLILAAQSVAESEGIADPSRGFRLVMNVGEDALNSVPHLHLHLLGGRAMSWPPG